MSHVEYGQQNGPSNGAQAAQPPRNAMLLRLAYTLGFAVLAWALLWFSFALTVLQIIVTAVAGQRNPQLADFGSKLGSWMRDILRYLTGASDVRPFPLAPFPAA